MGAGGLVFIRARNREEGTALDKEFKVTFTITINGVTEVEAEDEDDAMDIVDGWDLSDFGDFTIGDSEVDVTVEVEEVKKEK